MAFNPFFCIRSNKKNSLFYLRIVNHRAVMSDDENAPIIKFATRERAYDCANRLNITEFYVNSLPIQTNKNK